MQCNFKNLVSITTFKRFQWATYHVLLRTVCTSFAILWTLLHQRWCSGRLHLRICFKSKMQQKMISGKQIWFVQHFWLKQVFGTRGWRVFPESYLIWNIGQLCLKWFSIKFNFFALTIKLINLSIINSIFGTDKITYLWNINVWELIVSANMDLWGAGLSLTLLASIGFEQHSLNCNHQNWTSSGKGRHSVHSWQWFKKKLQLCPKI